jgi:hypothetical protein
MGRVIAIAAVLLLSIPSAIGVQAALTPSRGAIAGWLAAIGIELAYLSLALLEVPERLRSTVRATAVWAVSSAILLNTLADYSAKVPNGLTGAKAFVQSFDWLLLALSVAESAPLSGLAFAIALILHNHNHRSKISRQTPLTTRRSVV